jgi:hypothetical protein
MKEVKVDLSYLSRDAQNEINLIKMYAAKPKPEGAGVDKKLILSWETKDELAKLAE